MWICLHAWFLQPAANVASVSKEEREKAKRVTYGAPPHAWAVALDFGGSGRLRTRTLLLAQLGSTARCCVRVRLYGALSCSSLRLPSLVPLVPCLSRVQA